MYGYIYKTTNLINNKIYIGQHTSKTFDKKYLGSGKKFKQALKKYGVKNFVCEILQTCDSYDELNACEKYWIEKCDSQNPSIGYNLCEGGIAPRFDGENHPMYGKHHTEEAKEKNRIAHLGKKASDDTKQKISEGNKKKHISDEHKLAISKANKGKKLSQDTRLKISESKKGKKTGPMSDETKEKLRQSNLGKRRTEETKKKLSESHKGNVGYWKNKRRSNSTKKKISDTLSNKPRYNRRLKYKVNGRIFSGLDEGADYFGVTKSCMSLWVKSGMTSSGEEIEVII